MKEKLQRIKAEALDAIKGVDIYNHCKIYALNI